MVTVCRSPLTLSETRPLVGTSAAAASSVRSSGGAETRPPTMTAPLTAMNVRRDVAESSARGGPSDSGGSVDMHTPSRCFKISRLFFLSRAVARDFPQQHRRRSPRAYRRGRFRSRLRSPGPPYPRTCRQLSEPSVIPSGLAVRRHALSGREENLDRTAFVHGLVAFGGLLQGEREVEDLARVDR